MRNCRPSPKNPKLFLLRIYKVACNKNELILNGKIAQNFFVGHAEGSKQDDDDICLI